MRRYLLALTCLTTLLTGVAYAATAIDQVAVIVNDGVVLNSEVEARIGDLRFQAQQRGSAIPPDQQLNTAAREQLIMENLQLQLASRNGIRPDDNTVNAAVSTLAKQNGLSLDAFRAKLDKTPGTSFDYLRNAIAREQVIERMRQRRMNDRINITDADIHQFMATPAGAELNRQLDAQLNKTLAVTASVTAPTMEYLVTQVLVPVEENASTKEQVRLADLAQQILRLQTQSMTPEQAVDSFKGKAPEAAIEPLGWRSTAQLPTLLQAPLARLIDSGTPELIRSPRGWHLLWLLDRRELRNPDTLLPPPPPVPTTVVKQREVRHILMRPNDLQSSEDIREAMNVLYKKLKNGADFAELARINSQDPGSAVKGGDPGWVSPGDMVPEFDRMIGQTPISAISQPFQSSFGWHILRIEGEREKDMRETVLRDRAKQILFARAYDEELGAWLRELRAEAYVDFRGGN
ncbi:MAG: peptidylprolyl isomerase [Paraperlucidibaca sp.]